MLRKNACILLNGFPLAGSVLFVILYFMAASQYPGGSQADAHSPGFSWMNNYWCNLLNEYAINGERNPARPVAITAMAVVGLTLVVFWFRVSAEAPVGKATRAVTRISGVLSMATAVFLSTAAHDWVVNIASLFGLVAIGGTFICMKALRWRLLLWLGFFNLLLVAVNNILYYGNGGLVYLPGVQKVTFLSFLVWISAASCLLIGRVKKELTIVN